MGLGSVIYREFKSNTTIIILYALSTIGYRIWTITENMKCSTNCIYDYGDFSKIAQVLFRTSKYVNSIDIILL